MPRRTAQRTESEDNEQSPDDDGLTQLLAQKLQNSRDKKIKEKHQKFLTSAKRELDDQLAVASKAFKECSDEINALYQKFQIDYASTEDEIRGLWCKIASEHQNFLGVAEELSQLSSSCEVTRDAQQLQALVTFRKGCTDSERLVLAFEDLNFRIKTDDD
ncbi:hypothetical protein SISNIDRAFT_492983 [Sistotremastrum niveocremeum HHB9708]|uniref:Uncharacterized protein n=1 Tax=Sistotremastrum niveocremeum HHB9708 TaxID=1314777 RepID=A0A164ZDJ9_9AGAM|nr:hypothetical protein SISNIDRAFT_492983 [Sistotremastrum niveocremeum HHB9708]